MEYRILIVDEEATTRRQYAEALIASPPATGVSYRITTTGSLASGQLQATRQRYHLLITPLRARGEALVLAGKLRERFPDMRLLLLSDHHTPKAYLEAAQRLNARVVDLQLRETQLARLVGEMLGLHTSTAPSAAELANTRPPATLADVQLLLDVLRRQAQAQLVLYTDNIGNIIAQRGDDDGLEVTSLSSLIAGSFVNSLEMGRVLRDPDTSHLSVQEGRYHDVYASNVGESRLIALVFDKEFIQPKLGFVWLLLKRGAEQLRSMRIIEGSVDEVLSRQLTDSLNLEFDRLFGNELVNTEF